MPASVCHLQLQEVNIQHFLLYMHNPETFTQSEEKKSRIEASLGDKPN